jgi:hypothetical protein
MSAPEPTPSDTTGTDAKVAAVRRSVAVLGDRVLVARPDAAPMRDRRDVKSSHRASLGRQSPEAA